MGETQLGRMQFRIMQVLWDRGRASAREITDALNEREPFLQRKGRLRLASEDVRSSRNGLPKS